MYPQDVCGCRVACEWVQLVIQALQHDFHQNASGQIVEQDSRQVESWYSTRFADHRSMCKSHKTRFRLWTQLWHLCYHRVTTAVGSRPIVTDLCASRSLECLSCHSFMCVVRVLKSCKRSLSSCFNANGFDRSSWAMWCFPKEEVYTAYGICRNDALSLTDSTFPANICSLDLCCTDGFFLVDSFLNSSLVEESSLFPVVNRRPCIDMSIAFATPVCQENQLVYRIPFLLAISCKSLRNWRAWSSLACVQVV